MCHFCRWEWSCGFSEIGTDILHRWCGCVEHSNPMHGLPHTHGRCGEQYKELESWKKSLYFNSQPGRVLYRKNAGTPPEILDQSDLFKCHVAMPPEWLDQSDSFKHTYKETDRQTDSPFLFRELTMYRENHSLL